MKFSLPWKHQTPPIQPKERRPSIAELGAPGQQIFGGQLLHLDYNAELQAPMVYDTYDRMRLSDGTVGGLINAIKLPILNVDWRVKPASEDARDVEIAAFIERKLAMSTTSFQDKLWEILLYLDYGSMPFETVWELDSDNLVSLRKLAPRFPKSITAWLTDNHGGPKGIKQQAMFGNRFEEVEIPIEKLLIFINRKEGANLRGTSILRNAYKHWYYKDRMYIIDAIAKERRGVGVDVGTFHGSDIRRQDETDLQQALMGLHAHEKQFFIEQAERYTYRIEGLQGRPLTILDSINHHDLLMLRSVLGEFIALGSSGSGSYALSSDKSSFFTMSLNSIAKHIQDTFNTYLIKKWVDYNWNVDAYPTLVHSRIETRDMVALSTALDKLTAAGYISPAAEDEEGLRDALELAPRLVERDTNETE